MNLEPEDLTRLEADLANGQWLPRDECQNLITEIRLLTATIQQQEGCLRAMTKWRDALQIQQEALKGFCDCAIEERDALKLRVAELERASGGR